MRKIVHVLIVMGIIGILLSLSSVSAQQNIQHGLNARYYALSDLNTIIISRIDPQIAWIYNSWSEPNNGIAQTFNYNTNSQIRSGTPYQVTWSGYLEIPESGTYTFGGKTDDFGGLELYISGKWVDIVFWHSSWKIAETHQLTDHSGGYDLYDPKTINITKGYYLLQASMTENDGTGDSGFDFDWKRPGQTQWEVVPQEFLYPELPNTHVSSSHGNWYIYLVILAALLAVILAYFAWRRRPKLYATFKVEHIENGEMLICNIWNVKRSQIDDLIAYFEILGRRDMQRIGEIVRAKITTKQREIAERAALPASHEPARFPVVVFNQEINAAYIVSDSEEQTFLLPDGPYIIRVKIHFGRQVKQVSQEFEVVSESPHTRLSVFNR